MKAQMRHIMVMLFVWTFLAMTLLILSGCASTVAFEDCNHEPECIAKALAREDRIVRRNEMHRARDACRYPDIWDVNRQICRRSW